MSRWLGRSAFTVGGWQFSGSLPDIPKFVVSVAPHTSNWDFFVGIAAVFALGLRISFLGKDSIFRGPQGLILRWLGGIPVDRSVSRDRVSEMVEVFGEHARLVVGVTPEGTRKRVTEWKTGFYHVARGAGVPIVPVAFDYAKRTVMLMNPFYPTGDADGDVAKLRALYSGVTARHPENFVP